MKKLLKVIHNIIKGIFRVIFWLVVIIFSALIKLITYEPGKNKKITPRKARRIRFFTKLKRWFFNLFPDSVYKYFGVLRYKTYLNQHFEYVL